MRFATLLAILVLAAISFGGASTVSAQSLAQPVYTIDGSCQVSSFQATKTATGVTASMSYACTGRFKDATVKASLYFDPNYGKVSMVDATYAKKLQNAYISIFNPGRSLCSKDLASSFNFCDTSSVTNIAPSSAMRCLKDAISKKTYCPSWNVIGATDASGAAASSGLAQPVSLNPVGYPTTTPSTGTGVLPAGFLDTNSTRTDCATAVAKITWNGANGALKGHQLALKPAGCP